MKMTLIALAVCVTTLSAVPAAAGDQQRQNSNSAQQERDRNDNRGQNGRDQNDRGQNDRGQNGRAQDNRYGTWNSAWGARPSAPPRSFTRTADWHRHVRACQQRYRSYQPATDRYTVRRGQTAVCRL